MIEDLIELGIKVEDDNLWITYFELCLENSKFCGLTRIRKSGIKYYIDILDLMDTSNYQPSISSIQIRCIGNGNYYEIGILESYGRIDQYVVLKEDLKSTILDVFNWLTI